MTVTASPADLKAIKAKQQTTWADRTAQLSANDRAIPTMHPKRSQVTTTSTGLATTPYQELTAAPRADLITPGDPGYDQAPQSLSQRC